MIFTSATVDGAVIVDPEPHRDERGFFARTYCEREFAAHGLVTRYPQCNISYNLTRFTLRGLHYAAPPCLEHKLVCCTRGAICDVILDLRAGSPTCFQWYSIELTARNYRSLYIPAGLAHGFLTLEDDTEVFYQMGASYDPEAARTVRWDDPRFGVEWPHQPALMSDRDRSVPDYTGGPLAW
jgi:dTDP-4-dehydrorhamnose 3,5-epimerase